MFHFCGDNPRIKFTTSTSHIPNDFLVEDTRMTPRRDTTSGGRRKGEVFRTQLVEDGKAEVLKTSQ